MATSHYYEGRPLLNDPVDPWKKAEQILRDNMRQRKIPLTSDEMKPKVVYGLYPCFKDVKYETFRTKLNELRKAMRAELEGMTPPPSVDPWERAKRTLVDMIKKEEVDLCPQVMTPASVYNMHPCFKDVPYRNFRTNLNKLRTDMRADYNTAKFEESALIHDRNNLIANSSASGTKWNGSEAQKTMREDVKAGLALKDIRSKAVYKAFNKDFVRWHYYQEKRSSVGSSYWMKKQENELEKKQAKRAKKTEIKKALNEYKKLASK
jgi:hypothetical protein